MQKSEAKTAEQLCDLIEARGVKKYGCSGKMFQSALLRGGFPEPDSGLTRPAPAACCSMLVITGPGPAIRGRANA